MSGTHRRQRAIAVCAVVAVFSAACAPLGPDVVLGLHDLDRPAMLSKVDRIPGGEIPPHEHLHVADVDYGCTYEKTIVIVPVPGGMLAVQDVEAPEPEVPAQELGTFGASGEEVDFRVDQIDLRHTALWIAFFFREVDEVEMDCSAVTPEEAADEDAR